VTDPSHISFVTGYDEHDEAVVAVSLETVAQDGSGMALRIDLVGEDGLQISRVIPRGRISDDVSGQMSVRYQADDLVVDATLAPVEDTVRWALVRAVPDGPSWPVRADLSASSAEEVATMLPGRSPALETVPFGEDPLPIAVSAVLRGDQRLVAVVGDADGPVGTIELVLSEDDPDVYDLVAWRNDNRLVCGGDGTGRPEVAVLSVEMSAAARCDIAPHDIVLTERGIGPLRLGMEVDDAMATGLVRREPVPRDRAGATCGRASTRYPLAGADLRFADGVLVGLTVVTPDIPTAGGLRVGSSRRDVEDVVEEDHEATSFHFTEGTSRVREMAIGETELLCVPDF
jgi:hypothetical protein